MKTKMKMVGIRKIILGVALLLSFTVARGQEKRNLKVLYVGFSPEKPMPENLESAMVTGGMTIERFKQEYGKRMPAFKQLLQTYFTEVNTVDSRDYNEEMSVNYNVTIFDQTPTQIKERVIHRDPETGVVTGVEPPKYVSDDFSETSIFIGHTAPMIGQSLGSKLDWYCLCLDRHAHHTNTEHPIFKGPYKTTLTLQNRTTPSGALSAFDGRDLPSEIPMWEVDKEGYEDGNGFRTGMVARGWGLEDSPEAEAISSGVCTKHKTAVALGRHGNFFLWGFAGSPDYMTEEAKIVFVNTVVYMDKHANEKMIVRKFNDRIATKDYIDEMLFYSTVDAYKNHVSFTKEFNAFSVEKKKAAEKSKAEGKELSQLETIYLNSKPAKIKTREEYLEKEFGRQLWVEHTGLDTLAIRKFLNENRPYFYSQPNASYQLQVDEDVKSLGIANTDIAVLDKAIAMLEDGTEAEKAQRILLRYTLENFDSAQAWRNWFESHKGQMFFTQAGGYVWMLNDADKNPKIRPRDENDILITLSTQ